MHSSFTPDPRPLDPPEYWEDTLPEDTELDSDYFFDLDDDPCCWGMRLY